MKRHRYIVWAVALAAAAAWGGRAAWRVHKNIVSLHVRHAPLADVIRRLERQTWERIVTDSRLDTRVTLNVDDAPLTDVLDRIAEQAGGLMATFHAVYQSKPALEKLSTALRSGDITKADGWTNVAPRLVLFNGEAGSPEMNLSPALAGEGQGRRQIVTMNRDVVVRRDAPGERQAVSEGTGPIIRFRGVNAGGGGSVQEEIIIPEQIVMEAKLETRLKEGAPLAPNREAALAVARQVQGRCATFYTLRKSAVGGLGASTMRGFRSEFSGFRSTNTPGSHFKSRTGPPSLETAEREARRANLSRYLNLTPEQRARRAREGQAQSLQP